MSVELSVKKYCEVCIQVSSFEIHSKKDIQGTNIKQLKQFEYLHIIKSLASNFSVWLVQQQNKCKQYFSYFNIETMLPHCCPSLGREQTRREIVNGDYLTMIIYGHRHSTRLNFYGIKF